MEFSLTRAWEAAVAFLREHLSMLIAVVGGGALIAGIAQYLLMGDPAVQQAAIAAAIQSGDFGQIVQNNAALGPLASLGMMAVGLISTATQFAALRLGLSRDEGSVGSALGYGAVAALLSVLLFAGIALVAAVVVIVPIVLLAGVGGGAMIAILAVLIALALIPLLLWLFARLSVMQPAMAAARSANPLFGIAQSWEMTRGKALPIVGYYLLIGIVALVASAMLGAIVAIIGGALGPLVSAILSALAISAPAAVISTAIAAGLYRVLSPDRSTEIFG